MSVQIPKLYRGPISGGEEPPALSPELQAIVDTLSNVVRDALKPLTQVPGRHTPPAGDPNPDIEVRSRATDNKPPEKGIRFARSLQAMAAGRGDRRAAAYFAEHQIGDAVVAKALSSSSGPGGGFWVPEEFSSEFLELRSGATVVRKLGATSWPMETGTLTVPGLASGASATYIGENMGSRASKVVPRQLKFSAKKQEVVLPLSNDLIRRSSGRADGIVKRSALNAMSQKEDITFLRGPGTEFTPRGLRYWTHANNIIAANNAINLANVFADLGKAMRLVEESNATFASPGWAFTPRTKTFLLTLTDGNGNRPFQAQIDNGTLMGFPFQITNQLPNNLGAGGDESEIYYGDWIDAAIGESLQLIVEVSNEASYRDENGDLVSAFERDETVIKMIAEHDFQVTHDRSFAIITGVKWGAA